MWSGLSDKICRIGQCEKNQLSQWAIAILLLNTADTREYCRIKFNERNLATNRPRFFLLAGIIILTFGSL